MNAFEAPAADPGLWLLEPGLAFLNHGSFGSCPRAVLQAQQQWRERMERQPVLFFVRDLEAEWDRARALLAAFVGAPTEDLVFVPNATAGVNTVLRSIQWTPGDEVLVTDHEYNACRNALDYVAERSGVRVTVVALPFPVTDPGEFTTRILGHVRPKTRLALLDHVTSQTGLVLPLEEIVPALAARGVECLIDGAHAPGMIPLQIARLGAAYYTGNCHKWICAPKGAAFLYVHPERQREIRPLVISHGANSPRTDRSRFLIEFGWMGTGDPSSLLSVPAAIDFMASLMPEGWDGIRKRNRELALAARQQLCAALEIDLPAPDSMIGALASVPLPESSAVSVASSPLYADPLQDRLRDEHRIEVPVIPWPAPPKRLLRISAQLYNHLGQYRALAAALTPDLRIMGVL